MRRLLLLAGCLLCLFTTRVQGDETPATRGIGIYPGRASEYSGPALAAGGQENRNLAYRRAAWQSSSYDYNLTVQLATDGIISEGDAPWFRLVQDGEEINRRDRELLIDFRPETGHFLGPDGSEFILEFHGYAVGADRIEIAGNGYFKRVYKGFSAEISSDGRAWMPLGSTDGTAIDIPGGAEFTYCRIRPMIGSDKRAELRAVNFYSDGVLLDVLPSTRFHSCWKSLGAENEWICIDLGADSRLDKAIFQWKNAPVSGKIQLSRDGRKWRDAARIETAQEIPLRGRQARYIRALLDRTADGEPFELDEWVVMGRGGVVPVAQEAPAADEDGLELRGGNWNLQRASEVRPDSGETVSLDIFDDSGWLPATVPGTVLASYVDAGAVPDPNHADDQLSISDSYFRSAFWYRNTFRAAPGRERQLLQFDGINHRAEVFLNGSRIGLIDGAFRQAEFDVTGILRDGDNVLAVKVLPNVHYGAAKEQTAWSTQANGGIAGADNPTMHATIGWDWIPTVRGRDMGIWDDVRLLYRGPVTLKDVFVRSDIPLPDTSVADIFIEATLENHSDRPVSGRLDGSFGEVSFSREYRLAPNGSCLLTLGPRDFEGLRIKEPRLWWPKGYGEPNLYDFSLAFSAGDGVSDKVAFKTGIRRMDYKVEPFTPSPSIRKGGYPMGDKPERLCLYVNGRRFIGFGGNWGFPEMLLNYRGREYDTAVEYHADMNFTMIRNWVGQTGDREFYEACDRHGVMVWQDFWLANPYDGPDPYEAARFNEIATQYVRRIRNHPCIAIYVGRNEGFPPAEIENHLQSMVPAEHPGMLYYPHSAAYRLSGGGPYNACTPKDYFRLFGQDRLHSERGMPNVMNYENLVRALGEENVEPVSTMEHPNRMYGMHDYALGGIRGAYAAQAADSFNATLQKAFGEPRDARQFSQWAQWINYEGYRAMFEGRSEQRRGLVLWMSHPAWPSMVWQTYDYYFEPTGAYFGCKKACEPVHILYNPVLEDVQAVNYRGGDLSGITASAEILGLDGKLLWSSEAVIDLPEDCTVRCFPVAVPEEAGEAWFLRLRMTASDGSVVSENFYCQGREEGNLKALHTVGTTKVRSTVKWTEDGDCFNGSIRLENNSPRPAMMLRLKAVNPATGDLALPVFWSDNYFFLMPGESREIRVRVRREDCHTIPSIIIEGFNVKEKKI